jgi:hypothetical protein
MNRQKFDAEMRLYRADCPIDEEAENSSIDNPHQEADCLAEAEEADVWALEMMRG